MSGSVRSKGVRERRLRARRVGCRRGAHAWRALIGSGAPTPPPRKRDTTRHGSVLLGFWPVRRRVPAGPLWPCRAYTSHYIGYCNMFRSQHAFLIVVSTVLTFERTFFRPTATAKAHPSLICRARGAPADSTWTTAIHAKHDPIARPDVIHVTSDVLEVVSDVARWTRTDTVPSTHSRAN